MTVYRLRIIAVVFGYALLATGGSATGEQPSNVSGHSVPGEKIDSGLGTLPPYSTWSTDARLSALVARPNAVPGEKLDSGLGQLKHYRYWADGTGRLHETHEVASRR